MIVFSEYVHVKLLRDQNLIVGLLRFIFDVYFIIIQYRFVSEYVF